MTRDEDGDGSSDRADERLWIEIVSWDWRLSVGISSDLAPAEYRSQGGLSYVRGFDLWGRVLSPGARRGDTIRIWISPFNKEMRFGPDELDEVGRLYTSPPQTPTAPLTATLMLPEDAMGPLATCLGSVSKYLLVTTYDLAPNEASVHRFAFSSALPEGVTR